MLIKRQTKCLKKLLALGKYLLFLTKYVFTKAKLKFYLPVKKILSRISNSYK